MITFQTHNDIKINVDGTSLQAQIVTSFEKLVKTFGVPQLLKTGNTDAQWFIEFTDLKTYKTTKATIYNWKNGKAYNGVYGPPVSDVTVWNIGGKTRDVELLVRKLLNEI